MTLREFFNGIAEWFSGGWEKIVRLDLLELTIGQGLLTLIVVIVLLLVLIVLILDW